MIKRIRTLKRTGRFSELSCVSGTQGDFGKFNIIYAPNASGKSTLCDVFRSLTTGDGSFVLGRKRLDAESTPEIFIETGVEAASQVVRFQNGSWQNAELAPHIHVFDDRFVAENVLVGHHVNVDQRRNLYGLVIGSRAVALREGVALAEQNLALATSTHTKAEAEMTRHLPVGYTIESFESLPQLEEVDQKITTAKEGIANAASAKSKADSIRQRQDLRPLPLPKIPQGLQQALSTTLDDAALSAEQAIKKHLESTSCGLSTSWLEQGHRAQTSTNCPHCGQEMEGLELLKAYQFFFSGELKAQENLRQTIQASTDSDFGEVAQNRFREALNAHEVDQTWWQDAAGTKLVLPELRSGSSIVEAQIAVLSAVSNSLNRKQANLGSVVELTEEEWEAFADWEEIETEIESYNRGLVEINAKLALRKSEVGSIDLVPLKTELAKLEASEKRFEQVVIDAFSAFNEASRAKAKALKDKQKANELLRVESNQLLENYGARINELLELFAVSFRIVSEGVNFRGGPPSGNLAIELLGIRISSDPSDAANPGRPSLANTLSGGDRSALALAFFLATVEGDTDLANSVVIFDDPYHNQDRSRQRRTIEFVHRIARLAKQCFLFSHDLDFAHAVQPRYEIEARTFILPRLSEPTSLEVKELPLLASRGFERKYKQLTEFIASPDSFSEQLNLLAGTLRTILEEHFKQKFPLRWNDDSDWLGTMIGEIRNAEADDPLASCNSGELVSDLNNVNEYSQRFHHRSTGATSDVPDALELVTYARQTLSVIHR